jgi:DNA processing protein
MDQGIQGQLRLFDGACGSLLDHIGYEAIHVDQLAALSQHSHGSLAAQLLQLEIEGRIKSLPGNRYIRL